MTALTGTYRFMAPEVIRGERYDGRADDPHALRNFPTLG
jgi:serine/threonine protein kinase